MHNQKEERLTKLLTAARQSPNFGVRLLAELPAPVRAEAVRRWSVSTSAEVSRPGLAKCGPSLAPKNSFSSQQLAAFARAIGSVG